MKKVMVGLVLMAALCTAASARADYVCGVEYVPNSTSYGTAGYLYVSFDSNSTCDGYLTGSGYVCSTGATASGCTYKYSSGAITQLWQMLQTSIISGEIVNYYISGSFYTDFEFMSVPAP